MQFNISGLRSFIVEDEEKALFEKIKEQEEKNIVVGEDGFIDGKEGYVFYVETYDNCYMFKAKPDTIEKIHMSASGAIDKSTIFVTCRNALENYRWQDLNFDIIRKMLEEEFSNEVISRSMNKIESILEDFIINMKFRDKVKEEYKKIKDATMKSEEELKQDKRFLMRSISTSFSRKEMKTVFTFLKEFGFVE